MVVCAKPPLFRDCSVLVQTDTEDIDLFADKKRLLKAAAVAVQRMSSALPAMVLEVL